MTMAATASAPIPRELVGAAGVMLDKIASGELKVVEGKA